MATVHLHADPSVLLNSIKRSLERWIYTRHLTEERIDSIARGVLDRFNRSPVMERLSDQVLSYAEQADVEGLKTLFSFTEEGAAVFYLSSRVEGCIELRKQRSGAFKVISQALEIKKGKEGIETAVVAIVKPKLKNQSNAKEIVLNNLLVEALQLKECQDIAGMIRLRNQLGYQNRKGLYKVRLVLPWYEKGDLIDGYKLLNFSNKCACVKSLLEVIAGLERKGRVFRDIKADNILIDSKEAEGFAFVVCDPGLMHRIGERSIQISGSPYSMAPEYCYLITQRYFLEEKQKELVKERSELEKDQAAFEEKLRQQGNSSDEVLQKSQSAYELRWDDFFLRKKAIADEESAFSLFREGKLVEWTTSKLDVWSAALLAACLLRPKISSLIKREQDNGPFDKRISRAGYQWVKQGFIPGLKDLYPKDPLAALLNEMLDPIAERRLSAIESCARFSELEAKGQLFAC